MIYYEYRPVVKRSGKPRLITNEQLDKVTGFVSVYGFDEQGRKFIEETGGTRGIQGQTLYSNILYIDIDDNDPYALEVKDRLDRNEFGYKMYNTGGRGFHFHIPIVPMIGRDVPFKQRSWMQYMFPKADHSLYKTTGVIRAPNTFHEKHPGRFKQLIEDVEGYTLEIDTSVIPASARKALKEEEEYNNEAILDHLLMTSVSAGGRNNELYKRGAFCKKVGETKESALEILTIFNQTLTFPPLSSAEVNAIINSAYGRD